MKHDLIGYGARGLKASAVALALTGVAGTALAEDKKITFKTPSAFGTNLPITGSTSLYFADVLKKVSGGKLRIKCLSLES